ncbi:protein ALP1-like [Helianthus annuus]|uniref:protein ALP1-like n=1 Tax=Helianthus annuus TaxID=4232 RepID=UPI000B8F0205|nr:protein ALP1-like [Helianthus annuus]
MARLSLATRKRKQRRRTLILIWWNQLVTTVSLLILSLYMLIFKYLMDKPRIGYSYSKIDRYSILYRYVYKSDSMSISQIRMNRSCFIKLCDMLKEFGELRSSKNMDIDEQVAIFLHIIAHNVKNRVIVCRFHRSGETISRCVSRVCNAVIRLHSRLLKRPEPIPENSTDQRWKWFKNCLGALDGTYIKCLVPSEEKPKYRTRKGEITTNVLGVCSPDMQFVFVLPGWEGSAADCRVHRDALDRPHGLKVSRPGYYLVDAGYTNGEGFLAPYRGQRYHLNDWRDGHQPTTPKELFNMRHSSARNVIERCFGILKARWGILRDHSYYPIDQKNRMIMACCLLHNFIRREMPVDPFETGDLLDEGFGDGHGDGDGDEIGDGDGDGDEDNITYIETSNEWTTFRNNLAQSMFDAWNVTNG